jgi:hypothetical protein
MQASLSESKKDTIEADSLDDEIELIYLADGSSEEQIYPSTVLDALPRVFSPAASSGGRGHRGDTG